MTIFRIIMIGILIGLLNAASPISLQAKSQRVEEAQTILTKLGFYKGEIDGQWGSESREALNEFQKKHGFVVSRGLSIAIMEVLKTVDKGAIPGYVPISDRIGNTVIVDTGERIFYDTDGTKLIKLKNGNTVERKWRQMENGRHCETLYNKKEYCEGLTPSSYIIFKHEDQTYWFRRNGRRDWIMKLEEGNQL